MHQGDVHGLHSHCRQVSREVNGAPPNGEQGSLAEKTMKTLGLLVLRAICLSVSLPVLSTTAKAIETLTVKEEGPQSVAGPHLVWFADGYLTIQVRDVPLGELLDEIARQSGLTVMRYVVLDRKVTLEFHRLALEQGLRRILRHSSFVLEYTVTQPRTLWILPQGAERYVGQHRLVKSTNAASSGKDIATQISTLQATLKGGDAGQREEAALELGEISQAEAVAPLTLVLADKNEDVREAAVASLAEIGGAEAVQALAIALRDQNPRVREEAIDALGEIGGPIAIGLLEQALADDVEFVRQAATEALDELRGATR